MANPSKKSAAGRIMRMGDGAARSAAARALGDQSAGGKALARAMTAQERSDAARHAVRARWKRVRAEKRAAAKAAKAKRAA